MGTIHYLLHLNFLFIMVILYLVAAITHLPNILGIPNRTATSNAIIVVLDDALKKTQSNLACRICGKRNSVLKLSASLMIFMMISMEVAVKVRRGKNNNLRYRKKTVFIYSIIWSDENIINNCKQSLAMSEWFCTIFVFSINLSYLFSFDGWNVKQQTRIDILFVFCILLFCLFAFLRSSTHCRDAVKFMKKGYTKKNKLIDLTSFITPVHKLWNIMILDDILLCFFCVFQNLFS